MSKNTPNGTRVVLADNTVATILSQNAAWYTLELADGSTIKSRAAGFRTPTYEEALDAEDAGDEEAYEQALDEEDGFERDEEAPLTPGQIMARTLREARVRYTKAKTVNGTATAHCNDPIARELLGLLPEEVAELADKVLDVPAGTHMAKYGHLNPGQIRMNSGNRIRAYWKAALEGELEAPEALRVFALLNMLDDEQDEEGDEE
jgi:hypothetical protein